MAVKKLGFGPGRLDFSGANSGGLATSWPRSPFLFFLILLLSGGLSWGLSWPPSALAFDRNNLLPERELIQQGGVIPAWKQRWVEGRSLIRRGLHREATVVYEELLVGWPHLNEARWELTRLWLQLGEMSKALPHLEWLREARPDRQEYVQALASTLLATGSFARAARLFRQLLSQQPDNPKLLAGLAEALAGQGLAAQSLPYRERQVALGERNSDLNEQLARLYRQLGLPARALPLARQLAEPITAPDRLLVLAAEVYEDLGLSHQAVAYWRRLLARAPNHPRAAARLQAYLLTESQSPEALDRLLVALRDEPHNPQLLRRTIQVYHGLRRLVEAQPYLERYLAVNQADQQVLLWALDIYQALERQAEVLLILEQLLAKEGEPAPAKILQAAILFAQQGQYLRALELYPRILTYFPDDPAVMARKLFLLARLQRSDEIGQILNQLKQRGRVIEILSAWHELDPYDHKVMLALVFAYLEHGPPLASAVPLIAELLVKLAQDADAAADPDLPLARATFEQGRDRPYAALVDYEEFLRLRPERHDIRHRVILLAAELGMPLKVREHLKFLPPTPDFAFNRELRVAVALGEALDFDQAGAYFAAILSQVESLPDRLQALMEYAAVLGRAGMPYEAKQLLRTALLLAADKTPVQLALFELSMAQGQYAAAAIWLKALEAGPFYPYPPKTGIERLSAEARKLLRLRLWSATGEHRKVRYGARQLLAENHLSDPQRLLLVRLLLAADSLELAKKLLQELVNVAKPEPLALVLAATIEGRQAADFWEQALTWADQDPGRLLRLATISANYDFPEQLRAITERLTQLMPESLAAHLLRVDALTKVGETEQALEQLVLLPDFYPVAKRRSALLLQLGRFPEALELAEQTRIKHPWSEPELILTRVNILWLQRRWGEALRELEDALAPSVFELFAVAAQTAEIEVPADDPPNVWRRLGGEVSPLRELVAQAMSPEFAAAGKPENRGISELAAPLYATYRRQLRLSLELNARRAVDRREFFAARRHYELLQGQYPDEWPILYDLAGLYGRMGQREAAAAIYRQLAAAHLQYPGLAEAALRNELQRRPRTAFSFGYRREEGRDGHKALRQEWLGLRQWLTPALGHEFDLSLKRLRYRDPDGLAGLRGRRTELTYRRDMFAGVDLVMVVGGLFLTDGPNRLLGGVEIAGDLSDWARGRLSYRREAVSDTVVALKRGITADTMIVEAAINPIPRLETGAGYELTNFSDNNLSHGHDLWLSYLLLTDPTRLTLGYAYSFRDAQPGASSAGHRPYWAPNNYWRKTFEVLFRHQLTDDPFLRDIPRYYTIRYATTHDSQGDILKTLGGAFFMEWSPKFGLKAQFELSSSPKYRAREFAFSLNYRW